MSTVDEVLSRLASVLGAQNDSDLARKLDVARTTLSSWRARGTVPYAECVKVSEQHRVDIGWLLTGRAQQAARTDASRVEEATPPMYAPRDMQALSFGEKLRLFADASALIFRVSQRTGLHPPDGSNLQDLLEFVLVYGADERMVEDLLRLLTPDIPSPRNGGTQP